jgi:hypothetical protein
MIHSLVDPTPNHSTSQSVSMEWTRMMNGTCSAKASSLGLLDADGSNTFEKPCLEYCQNGQARGLNRLSRLLSWRPINLYTPCFPKSSDVLRFATSQDGFSRDELTPCSALQREWPSCHISNDDSSTVGICSSITGLERSQSTAMGRHLIIKSELVTRRAYLPQKHWPWYPLSNSSTTNYR